MMARTSATMAPSSFTEWAPAATSARAVATACAGESYDPAGMSPVMCVWVAPLATARTWCSIIPSDTARVEWYPSSTSPRLSPTRMTSRPTWSSASARR